jgi:lipoate---protein ligase
VKPTFRVIDTGVREGRINIAFDQALIELHKQGAIPDTIRFLQFRPSALIGRHQALSREVRLDHCRRHGIGVARRITGGGALYMDEGQFGFELLFHRRSLDLGALSEVARSLCEAAAAGLQGLGVAARFRPRNDIEVDGRKISGTGGFFDGDTIFYQGTILVDMDPRTMLDVLNVPREKLAKRALDSAERRIVTLRQLLGDSTPSVPDIKRTLLQAFSRRLNIDPVAGAIGQAEESLAQKLFDDEIGRDEFIEEIDDPQRRAGVFSASVTGSGGTIAAHVRLEGHRIREVLITGDFFVTPPRTILDLEANLRGVEIDAVNARVEGFFASAQIGMLSATWKDFADAIDAAVASASDGPSL